mmetsp:Transcript_59007/g.118469  ORF Transcript_59007/g.118469 Transcript_59007/m.118469 type:complete len:230 (+) Transcript_59007:354-1043(+)
MAAALAAPALTRRFLTRGVAALWLCTIAATAAFAFDTLGSRAAALASCGLACVTTPFNTSKSCAPSSSTVKVWSVGAAKRRSTFATLRGPAVVRRQEPAWTMWAGTAAGAADLWPWWQVGKVWCSVTATTCPWLSAMVTSMKSAVLLLWGTPTTLLHSFLLWPSWLAVATRSPTLSSVKGLVEVVSMRSERSEEVVLTCTVLSPRKHAPTSATQTPSPSTDMSKPRSRH